MFQQKRIILCSITIVTGLTVVVFLKGITLHIHQPLVREVIKSVQNVNNNIPTIYLITPTYSRPVQKAELTRVSHTLLHVSNLHWIVVEDSDEKTKLVTHFLATCKVTYTQLNRPTPERYRNQIRHKVSRGVLQRTAGLDWIRMNLDPAVDKGVVYFADDDNTYSLELFEEMRYTKRVSVWPVGLVGAIRYESPIVGNGKVTGWRSAWKPERKFAIDMAGFAVNIDIVFKHRNVTFSHSMLPGTLETSFLTDLGTTMNDLEPMADGCTKVLVWHTRTEQTGLLRIEEITAQKFRQKQFEDIEV